MRGFRLAEFVRFYRLNLSKPTCEPNLYEPANLTNLLTNLRTSEPVTSVYLLHGGTI